MKCTLLSVLLLCFAQIMSAQGVGIGTSSPDQSAMLEISSDSTGVLVPRMTATQRDAIVDPATGLLVFVTTDSSFYYFGGTGWSRLGERASMLVDSDEDTRVLIEQTPDDDIIRFISRDSQILIIDSTGNIGIGDSVPGESLTLKGGNFLQTPTNPMMLDSVNIGSVPRAVQVLGRYAYVIDAGSDDLKVIDISDPDSLIIKGTLSLGTNPRAIYVTGHYAYVLDGGLRIIDVSNPGAPVQFSLLGSASGQSIYVSGRHAYIVEGSDLKLVDITSPTAPDLLYSLAIGTSLESVYVSGRYVYTLDGSGLLRILDMLDLSVLGALSVGPNPRQFQVSGHFVYVVDETDGTLRVINASDPGSMSLAGSLVLGGSLRSLHLNGRYAYVLNATSDDIKVIDVSKPDSLVISGTLVVGETPTYLDVVGEHAYILEANSGSLKVVKVSGLEATSVIAHSLRAGNIQVSNDISALWPSSHKRGPERRGRRHLF